MISVSDQFWTPPIIIDLPIFGNNVNDISSLET
jgi:hypothetical protein